MKYIDLGDLVFTMNLSYNELEYKLDKKMVLNSILFYLHWELMKEE